MPKVKLNVAWLGKPGSKAGDVIEVSNEVAEDITVRGKRGPIASLVKETPKPVGKKKK